MRRTEINAIMRKAMGFLKDRRFELPPFAFWSPDEWRKRGHEADEIRRNALGWDITDFGSGDFQRLGLFIFTIRNGNLSNPDDRKAYAEKILIVEEDQVTPMHFHWSKMEDIINRGGGNLMMQLYNATEDEKLADTPVEVSCDGVKRTVPAGGTVRLTPGESITIVQRLYHKFWGESGKGTVLVGEVSSVNDDRTDNRFREPMGRFPQIEEDEAPLHLLCNEYPEAG
jgi:hypothetical protein